MKKLFSLLFLAAMPLLLLAQAVVPTVGPAPLPVVDAPNITGESVLVSLVVLALTWATGKFPAIAGLFSSNFCRSVAVAVVAAVSATLLSHTGGYLHDFISNFLIGGPLAGWAYNFLVQSGFLK